MPILSNQPQQTENQQPVGRRERGTGFTNIGRLLGANVGAGEQMGQTIGSTIGSKAGQLKADVSKAGSEFQRRFGESVGQAQDVFGKASGLIPSSPTGISSGLSGMSEEEAKKLGQQLTEAKTYRGPSSLEGQEQIGARAKSVAGMGELAKAGSIGQGLLMQNIAGKAKPYTRGQSTLDTLLMGQSKEAQKAIREGAAQTYGAEQQAQTAIGGASQQAKEAAGILGKQQADVLSKAIKSGQDIQTLGKERANIYNQQTLRANELLKDPSQFGIKTDPVLGKVYDPAKAEEDKMIMTTLAQRGLGTDVTVDPTQTDYLNNLLKNLATGEINVNSPYFQEPERMAFRNLALITQQPDLAKNIEETSPFKTAVFTGGEDIKKGQIYQDMMKAVPEELSSVTNRLEAAKRHRDIVFGKIVVPNAGQELTNLTKIIGNVPYDYINDRTINSIINDFEVKKEALNQQLTKRMSLQDYLSKLFGQNLQRDISQSSPRTITQV